MVHIYAFYADIFWLNNFLLHAAILFLSKEMQKEKGKRQFVSCVLSAAVGSTMELMILLCLGYRFFLGISFLAVVPLMIFLAFGRCRWKVFFKINLLCWAMTIILGGITAALDNWMGISQIPLLAGILGVILGKMVIHTLYAQYKIQRLLLPVILKNEGKSLLCTGLVDTGNLLRDPYRRQPVHIVNENTLKQIPVKPEHFLGMIPYQAVGTETGLLEIYQIEGMGYCRGGKEAWICPVILAKAPGGLLDGKEYEVILNSEIIYEYCLQPGVKLQEI